MTPEDGGSLIWGVVCALMLIASLAARRLPLGQTLKMALAWVAIFAGVFALFSFRHELSIVWNRMKDDIAGTSNQSISGQTVALIRKDDGHFWAKVKINGQDVDFMIDSGATQSAVSTTVAMEIGLDVDDSGFPILIDTANGTVKAKRAVAQNLELGPIKLVDHHMTVSDNLGDTNLLGMNFLDSLQSWNVQGDVMTLTS